MAYPNKKTKLAVMIAPGSAPDEPDHDEGEFPAPKGLDLEGKKPGDTLEVVCVLEVKEGGMLCVRKVNGMDVAGYDEEKNHDEEIPEDDKDSFTSAAMGQEAPAEDTAGEGE